MSLFSQQQNQCSKLFLQINANILRLRGGVEEWSSEEKSERKKKIQSYYSMINTRKKEVKKKKFLFPSAILKFTHKKRGAGIAKREKDATVKVFKL